MNTLKGSILTDETSVGAARGWEDAPGTGLAEGGNKAGIIGDSVHLHCPITPSSVRAILVYGMQDIKPGTYKICRYFRPS